MLLALIAGAMAPIAGGTYTPLLFPDAKVEVRAFELDRTPVTNAGFLDFVRSHPEWARAQVPARYAEERYLSRIETDAPKAPVVFVSWFAAKAFCEARGARLPTEAEWELAASADETRRDARQDPAFTQRLLAWYGRPNPARMPEVGGATNVYGISNLHGLVWEWVDDFMSTAPADGARFCGPGAANAANKNDYAAFMRTAFRSSLEAKYTVANLGFRCARTPGERPHPAAAPLKGPAVASMFYGSCASACPLLFEKLKRVEGRLSPRARERIRFDLMTFDPANDTAENLSDLATAHGLDAKRWKLESSDERSVRERAALLGVRYRFVNGAVSHSTVIALVDAAGNIGLRLEGLDAPEDALVAAIERLIAGG
jgi:sulfatase modifying factor 1